MKHLFDISCTFFEYIGFSDSGIDPDDVLDDRAIEYLQRRANDLAMLVGYKTKEERWGPLKWVYVGIGDDNEDHSPTQVEHLFTIQYAAKEDEIELIPRSKGRFCLTEDGLSNIQEELEDHLHYDYAPSLLIGDGPARKVSVKSFKKGIAEVPGFKPNAYVLERMIEALKSQPSEGILDDRPKKTRTPKGRRFQALRVDALVGNAEHTIEKVFDLPNGSVQLVLPSGKKARSNKLIKSLIRDWNEADK